MGFERMTFEFPMYVTIYENGSETGTDELAGAEAYDYLSEEDIDTICESFNCADLYMYFHDGEYVTDMEMELTEQGTARIHVIPAKVFSEEEKEELHHFLKIQMSDGWGEGMSGELFTRDDVEYSVSFWEE